MDDIEYANSKIASLENELIEQNRLIEAMSFYVSARDMRTIDRYLRRIRLQNNVWICSCGFENCTCCNVVCANCKLPQDNLFKEDLRQGEEK